MTCVVCLLLQGGVHGRGTKGISRSPFLGVYEPEKERWVLPLHGPAQRAPSRPVDRPLPAHAMRREVRARQAQRAKAAAKAEAASGSDASVYQRSLRDTGLRYNAARQEFEIPPEVYELGMPVREVGALVEL